MKTVNSQKAEIKRPSSINRPDSSSTMVDHRIPGKPILERVPISKPRYWLIDSGGLHTIREALAHNTRGGVTAGGGGCRSMMVQFGHLFCLISISNVLRGLN